MEPMGINNDNVPANNLTLAQLGKCLNTIKQHADVLINSIESATMHYKKIEEQTENQLLLSE